MLPFLDLPLGPKRARSHRNAGSSQRANVMISDATHTSPSAMPFSRQARPNYCGKSRGDLKKIGVTRSWQKSVSLKDDNLPCAD